MRKLRIGILGGDYRYKILRDIFISENNIVKTYGNIHIEDSCNNIEEMLSEIDILIGPIPYSKDKINVNLFCEERITIEKLLKVMQENKVKYFIAGVIDNRLREMARDCQIKVYDFFDIEAVAVKNAIPTAEGAIMTAMQESEKTIFGSENLVLGFGRCGKILSNMLKGIGANVTISYRSERDKAYITAYGFKPINIAELKNNIECYDFIFNTIPDLILDHSVLDRVCKKAVIIDIAQAPGGVDFSYARNNNLRALYCPGLPSRIAPVTAAEILKEAIDIILYQALA